MHKILGQVRRSTLICNVRISTSRWIIFLCLVAMMLQHAAAQPGSPKTNGTPATKVQKGMPKGYEKFVAVTLPTQPIVNQAPGSLIRELGRQALLIAAESELGLFTLDKSIGEVIPIGTVARGPFVVNVVGNTKVVEKDQPPRYEFILSLTRPELSGGTFQWSAPPAVLPPEDYLEPFVEHVESLSRGPLLEGLKKAGYEKSKVKTTAKPAGKLQHPLDIVGQFALVRELHSQHQANETPELLGQLVEAYAILGNLTNYQWSSASKAYRARSLIYAQRLIAKYERTPYSLAHCAFARAMCGRHGAALSAIQEAKNSQGTAAPNWLPLIEAYCRFDTKPLDDAEEQNNGLASYLRILMLDLDNEKEQSFDELNSFLSFHPTNCHAINLMAEIDALGARRTATGQYFPLMWFPLIKRIAALPNLPATVKAVADGGKNRKVEGADEFTKRKDLIAQLQFVTGIKNQPGPSWPALGDLLRNTAFSQTWHTLDVQANYLSIDTATAFKQMKPVVQGHTFEKALLLFVPRDSTVMDSIQKMVEESDSGQFEVVTIPLANALDVDLRRQIYSKLQRNSDVIYEDVVGLMSGAGAKVQNVLLKISPHWPTAIAASLLASPDVPQLEWEEKYGNSNVVLRALYRKYIKLNRTQDAIRCLKKSIALTPACSTYVELANLYQQQGDTDQWYETLAKAVKETQSIGLEHATVHEQLAKWHMAKAEWDKAKPHALAAAASFSHWGLETGAEWAQGAGEWELAEKFTRDCAIRYRLPVSYYHWCIRTGHGNREAAHQIAQQYWDSEPQPRSIDALWEKCLTMLAAGDRAKAKDGFYSIFKERRVTDGALYAAILADEDGETTRRDEIFREIETSDAGDPVYRELTNCFRGVLSGKEAGRWNPRVMEMLAANSGYESSGLYLLAARFLAIHQQKQLADEYLVFAAASPRTNALIMTAVDLARKQNLSLGKRRTTDFSEAAIAVKRTVLASSEFHRAGSFEVVDTMMNSLVTGYPGYAPALLARANYLEQRERYALAIADLEEVLKIDPSFYYAHVQLARILSTCENAQFRNGKKALEHAEKAAAWRQCDTWVSASALASAHAECGNYAKAVEFETRARSLPGFDHAFDERLDLYKSGKPYHGKFNTKGLEPNVPVTWRWH